MKDVEKLILEKMKEIYEIMCEHSSATYLNMCIVEGDDGKILYMANNRYWVGGTDEKGPINFYYKEGVDDEI